MRNSISTQYLHVSGVRLEVKSIAGRRSGPTLVLLHEGLGCVDSWRYFPESLATATGLPVFAYSRQGYGRSDSCTVPRPLDYMHREGLDVLPALLLTAGIDDHVLIGHSDGGSIALIYAGSELRKGLRAIVTLSAHVFCEELTVNSIVEAKIAFEQGELRSGLQKYHGDNTDCAFLGWNGAWLHADFMRWNIEQYVSSIRVPMLVIQGKNDQYGTLAQVESISAKASGEVTTCLLDDCGHFPHKEQPAATLSTIEEFLKRYLRK